MGSKGKLGSTVLRGWIAELEMACANGAERYRKMPVISRSACRNGEKSGLRNQPRARFASVGRMMRSMAAVTQTVAKQSVKLGACNAHQPPTSTNVPAPDIHALVWVVKIFGWDRMGKGEGRFGCALYCVLCAQCAHAPSPVRLRLQPCAQCAMRPSQHAPLTVLLCSLSAGRRQK